MSSLSTAHSNFLITAYSIYIQSNLGIREGSVPRTLQLLKSMDNGIHSWTLTGCPDMTRDRRGSEASDFLKSQKCILEAF